MLTIVTSFNRAIWNNHGKTCIESWIKHLYGPLSDEGIAPDYHLHLYIDGPIPSDLPKSDNIHVHWLDTEPEYVKFLTETRDVTPNPNIPPEHKFRFEFRRFWPKVFAINHALHEDKEYNPLLWLDADILFKKDLSVERILEDVKEEKDSDLEIACLDRGPPWNYMDSGYVLFGNISAVSNHLIESLCNVYTTKTIFRFTEWHDAFLMSQVMNILWGDNKGDFVKSLSGLSSSLHPLDDSWLAEYMTHLKGQLKATVNEIAAPVIEAPRRTDV